MYQQQKNLCLKIEHSIETIQWKYSNCNTTSNENLSQLLQKIFYKIILWQI